MLFHHLQNMAMTKFSDTLPVYKDNVTNVSLQQTLHQLAELLKDSLKLLEWGNKELAVPLNIAVELPPLGNYNGIDIRENEPILLVFDTNRYPAVAPKVFTDRTDFPKNKLAHLYIAKSGRPPGLCYVRGDSNEWYANKRIKDLITRVGNWLRDATTGELAGDGNQFEPLRLEGYSGTIVFDHDLFSKVVNDNKTVLGNGGGMAIALFERTWEMKVGSYRFVKFVTGTNVDEVMTTFEEEEKKGKDAPNRKPYYLGYLLWSNAIDVYEDYEIDLPGNLQGFRLFCERFGIDWRAFENFIAIYDRNIFISFPVIIAIKRPKNLIGFSSNIEFVNFRFPIDGPDTDNNGIITNVEIDFQLHNQPLTTHKAKVISGPPNLSDSISIVFGCGALGSKIIMHLVRSGNTDLILVDPDTISPHNLVRHSLLPQYTGVNKAVALVDVIKKMFPIESEMALAIERYKDELFTPEKLKPFHWIMDFTASHSFFNKLVMSGTLHNQVASASITNFGNLGILYIEGKDRNPRIDDLQSYLYNLYDTKPWIADWLKHEKAASENDNLIIQVGVGCNSETIVLADDKISSHSAYFSGVIKKSNAQQSDKGKIFLSRISEEDFYAIETECIQVDPFDVIPAVNNETWDIRFKKGVQQQIIEQSQKAGLEETGGVFVGMINQKTNVITVTGLIDAPSDSKANRVCFWRGYEGLAERVSDIISGSGGQIGYIGEWHSHPIGPNGLSDVDMKAVARFKSEFSTLTTPLPVFLAVVAPAGILPFVF
jgi:hypothetical protein